MRRYMGRVTRFDREMYRGNIVDHLWLMGRNGELECLDCSDNSNGVRWNDDDEDRIIIDEEGVDINIKDGGDSFKLKIDENGVEIKADDGGR
jgi:hypothetical protein